MVRTLGSGSHDAIGMVAVSTKAHSLIQNYFHLGHVSKTLSKNMLCEGVEWVVSPLVGSNS